jgi:Uma2 family endonuclease
MATTPAAGTTGLTYDDLLSFPDDGLRRELIGGELFVTPSPSFRHQGVVTELVIALGLYGREQGGKVRPAPMDVFLSERDVVEPDLLFLTAANLSRAERPFIRGAPDVVVEVSSPSTRRHDLVRKLELYERFGVPEYWFVDLDADRVEVHRLTGDRFGPPIMLGRGEQLTSPLLPGFEASVDGVLGPADELDAAP